MMVSFVRKGNSISPSKQSHHPNSLYIVLRYIPFSIATPFITLNSNTDLIMTVLPVNFIDGFG